MRSLPLLFSTLSCLFCFSIRAEEEIRLSYPETPDDTAAYYLDDPENDGNVSGGEERVNKIDDRGFPMHVGDWAATQSAGRMVKYFLLFRLPGRDATNLERATLRLFLNQIQHEKSDAALPPVRLGHASAWPDEEWVSRSRTHGLLPVHFGDQDTFSQTKALCDSSAKAPGFVDIDVTEWIRSDMRRSSEAISAFRLELEEPERLDVADNLANSYNFWGPGMSSLPERAPSLLLTFRD